MASASAPSEGGVENSILQWLEGVGWETYGLGSGEGAHQLDEQYDRDLNKVVYWGLLEEWLVESDLRNNHVIDDDNVEEFLSSLRRDLNHDNLMEANEEFQELLRRGKKFSVTNARGETENVYIQLIDFVDIENNRFVAANQMRVKRSGDIRPDINLFVNGIPLVTMELKSLAQDNDFFDAISDLHDYEEQESRLFVPGLLNVAADTMELRYGAVGAPTEHYYPWNNAPEEYQDEANPMRQAIRALCNPGTLLDILDNFVFYERLPGQNAKIIPRYMQYYAVQEILEQIQNDEFRRGLIWHTQGSGKSYTMMYAVRNLLERDIIDNPQLLIVVDTDDLATQMEDTLSRLNFSHYEVARTGYHLQELLERGASQLVLTTVQKFHDIEPDSQGNENTIIMSDEAHRYMEKDLGNRLEAALPTAHHFGFTGTPVREHDRDTFENYGRPGSGEPYIHRYSIRDGIQDGLILPVYFTLRHQMEWDIDEEGLDAEFDEEFSGLPIGEKQEIIKEYVTSTEIAELRPRVEEVVREIDEHFQDIEKNGWKGMVVTPSREAAALYGEELQKYRDPEEIAVLYSEVDGDDDGLVRQFHTISEERDNIIDDFKEAGKNPKLLVVCDMLLTGFDAPILKTMYLDRNLQDHSLLQAIARTNRPAEGKNNGEIVDFQGVFANIDDALDYDPEVRQFAAQDEEQLFEDLETVRDDLLEIFEEIPREGTQESLNKCLARLSKQPYKREFKQGYRKMQDLYESLSPDPRLVERGIQDDYSWLTKVYVAFRRHNNREDNPEENLREKTKEIIAENVDIDEIKDDYPVYKLSEDHLAEVQNLSEPAAQAASIEHATREHLQPRVDRNPKYQSLSDRLNDVVHAWQAEELSDPEAVEKLERIEREVLELEEEIQRRGLNGGEYAIYAELAESERKYDVDKQTAEDLSTTIWTRFDEGVNTSFDGWQHNANTRRSIRQTIIRALAKEGHPELAKDDALLERIIGYIIENAE